MAGGGGYGDPYARDPELVLEDVIEGRVTPEHARAAYGVAILEGAPPRIDQSETDRLRRHA
jgi:N-methylhydantoinase B